MLKNVSINLLFTALLLVLVVSFFIPNSAKAEPITGNNNPGTAKAIGYWKYSTLDTTILPEGENAAYYQFTINKGERVYVRSTRDQNYTGMEIEVYNPQYSSTGSRVINPGSYGFIFANTGDVTSTSETYYVKVTRGTYTGNMYLTVSIEDRIKTGSGKLIL